MRVDRRGIHFKEKVAAGIYTSPSYHAKAWRKTAEDLQKELEKAGLSGVLANFDRDSGSHSGSTRRSIYMYLELCSANGVVVLERSDTAPSFYGITKFTIMDREKFDKGGDEYGVVHTVTWAVEKVRKSQAKTIVRQWAGVGMRQSAEEVTGRLVYTYDDKLYQKHMQAMQKEHEHRKQAASSQLNPSSSQETSAQPIAAVVLLPLSTADTGPCFVGCMSGAAAVASPFAGIMPGAAALSPLFAVIPPAVAASTAVATPVAGVLPSAASMAQSPSLPTTPEQIDFISAEDTDPLRLLAVVAEKEVAKRQKSVV